MLIKIRFLLAILLICSISIGEVYAGGGGHSGGSVSVRGYYRSNGTYVAPHYRSAPDGDFSNNWSTVGNVNPYTGEEGTKTHPSNSSQSSPYISPPLNYAPLPNNPDNSSSTKIDESISGIEEPSKPPIDSNAEDVNAVPKSTKSSPLPKNARLNYLGNDWECDRGYRKIRNGCDAVVLPPNAKLTYLGNDWECERGYKRSHDKCESVYKEN